MYEIFGSRGTPYVRRFIMHIYEQILQFFVELIIQDRVPSNTLLMKSVEVYKIFGSCRTIYLTESYFTSVNRIIGSRQSPYV